MRIRNDIIIEGSLEVKLPTIWTDEKQSRAEAERRGRLEERRSEKRKSKKKEDTDTRKGRKVAKHYVFQWFVAPEGRKVGSLKRRVRSPLARWVSKNYTPLWREVHLGIKMYKTHRSGRLLEVEMSKKCTPLWRETHFQVKMYKTHQVRTTFGSWMSKKCTPLCREAHFQVKTLKTLGLRPLWKLRCRKSARRCGTKHISKSKYTKHTIVGPLLEVPMSKKYTRLWREVHF